MVGLDLGCLRQSCCSNASAPRVQGLADVSERYAIRGKEVKLAGLSHDDAEKMSKIYKVTHVLSIADYKKSVGDHHFEYAVAARRKKGILGVFSRRTNYLDPDDPGRGSVPATWEEDAQRVHTDHVHPPDREHID